MGKRKKVVQLGKPEAGGVKKFLKRQLRRLLRRTPKTETPQRAFKGYSN